MKEADKEIRYRPELAKQLSRYLEVAVTFYGTNFRKAYYTMLSRGGEEAGDKTGAEYFKKLSKCVENTQGSDSTYEERCQQVMKEYGVTGNPISEAGAAYFVFEAYKPVFKKCEEQVLKENENLTKMEQYMVSDFFLKLMAPMRNPNIEIKDGNTECWYDKEYRSSFSNDLKQSVEFVKRNCQNAIDIFSIPDDKELENNEKEIER